MKHISRALFLTLAVLVFAAPAAFAANSISGADTEPAPGPSTVTLDISNDADLKGIAFSLTLVNVSAVSASMDAVTINLTELPRRRSSNGDQYMMGRLGEELPAGVYAGAVSVDVTVDGVTGDQALLIICGANPHASPLYVGAEIDPSATFLDCDTVVITVKAGIVANVVGSCPTYGQTYEGGGVAAHISTTANIGIFVSLDLLSITKDGSPAVPANEPELTGLNLVDAPDAEELIMSWEAGAGEAR